MTSEGLTLWRNAVYVATGLEVPTTLYDAGIVKSSDASLASLAVSVGDLSPVFDSNITTYSVYVPSGTTSVDVTATTSDVYAEVEGVGTFELGEGQSTAEVVVIAEDGTERTYTIVFSFELDINNYDNAFSIYPNPVGNVLNINGKNLLSVQVFNLTGMQIAINKISDNQYDVSALNCGVYVVKLVGEDNDSKVVKINKR
ncbi:MAG: cadherin-like beta sandwich domain-containing protein [Prolixibacteraceae bacterium]|jgi:hypothetical protein|nr:cadherin-like beta sandwich domain-containing protein [Prolixibacteraceae bacterium]